MRQTQAVDAWLAMVRGLAAQWFGMWVRPKAPADAWLLEGLAAYLEHLFISRFLGRNEAAYRCASSALLCSFCVCLCLARALLHAFVQASRLLACTSFRRVPQPSPWCFVFEAQRGE
jgi:hypothetical protein